jgi:hypothetical protein
MDLCASERGAAQGQSLAAPADTLAKGISHLCQLLTHSGSTGLSESKLREGLRDIAKGDSTNMESSSGLSIGVGVVVVISIEAQRGPFCGKGEMSIISPIGHGEVAGSGGVVRHATRLSVHVAVTGTAISPTLWFHRGSKI